MIIRNTIISLVKFDEIDSSLMFIKLQCAVKCTAIDLWLVVTMMMGPCTMWHVTHVQGCPCCGDGVYSGVITYWGGGIFEFKLKFLIDVEESRNKCEHRSMKKRS